MKSFGAALLFVASALWAEVAVPKLEGRVTDLTATLTAAEKQDLELRLGALEKKKGSQVVVLIVPTTGGEAIEQFSIRVAEAWKIGRKGVDDGVILILAKEDRKLRIEVGYGLEGALTDALANRIIREQMVPLLKKGDFAPAINAGVDSVIRVIEGEPLPAPAPGADEELDLENPGWKGMLIILGFGGIFWLVGTLVPLLQHKFLSAFAFLSGWIGFFAAWFYGEPWPVSYILGGCAAFAVGIVCAVSTGSGSRGSTGSSGRSGGGSSFSGGGGRFGGGGSSGSW
jgi:uncharacterized protein